MPQNAERYIAVFGDTHGRLRLMFQLARLWQSHHDRHLDGILQCGDLGFFPDPDRLDRATGRFAGEDPEELGFARFFRLPDPLEPDERLERWFLGPPESLGTIRATAFWCHGNHDDFEALAQLSRAGAGIVDCYGKLVYLPSGTTADVAGVRVAAVGGGFEDDEEWTRGGRRSFGKNFHPGSHGRWVDASDCDRLRTGEPWDILLTHVAARSGAGEKMRSGSQALRDLLENTQPHYHFFAHHRGPVDPHVIGRCRCFWLGDVAFTRRGLGHSARVNPGCMGMLRWRGPHDHDFTILYESWLDPVNGSNWLEL